MNKVATNMDFNVYKDLKRRDEEYNVKIKLENEVESNVRELAINISGTIVRNSFHSIYDNVKSDADIEKLILEKLNTIIGREVPEFKVNSVKISLKKDLSRK